MNSTVLDNSFPFGYLFERTRRLSNYQLFAFFTLIGFLLLARSLASFFVADDYEFLGRIDIHNAGQYFFKSWAYGNEFQPLLAYSYAVDRLFSGVSPVGYHITNTLIHIANAFLLVQIASALQVEKVIAVLGGLLFLIDPVCHEAVLWISGRPVILSSFFQLCSVWWFIAGPAHSKKRLLLSVVAFTLALMTYEGALATPFVLLVLFAISPQVRKLRRFVSLAPFGLILAIYSIVWPWTFRFQLVRARQHSSVDALLSMATALLHAWHGGYRVEIALFYAIALVWYLRSRKHRVFAGAALLLFTAAYLPFLAMAVGFADRFDYFPATALCMLLATLVTELCAAQKWISAPALAALLIFYSLGMENRISQWREAGEIAKTIPLQIVELEPSLPSHTFIAVAGVPQMWKHAYVFLTGLPRAISYRYAREMTAVKVGENSCVIGAQRYFWFDGSRVREVHCH